MTPIINQLDFCPFERSTWIGFVYSGNFLPSKETDHRLLLQSLISFSLFLTRPSTDNNSTSVGVPFLDSHRRFPTLTKGFTVGGPFTSRGSIGVPYLNTVVILTQTFLKKGSLRFLLGFDCETKIEILWDSSLELTRTGLKTGCLETRVFTYDQFQRYKRH